MSYRGVRMFTCKWHKNAQFHMGLQSCLLNSWMELSFTHSLVGFIMNIPIPLIINKLTRYKSRAKCPTQAHVPSLYPWLGLNMILQLVQCLSKIKTSLDKVTKVDSFKGSSTTMDSFLISHSSVRGFGLVWLTVMKIMLPRFHLDVSTYCCQ